jgi:hypothetical protein
MHFPPAVTAAPAAAPATRRITVIGCYADALGDVETAREKLKALLAADAEDRHGDLQVVLSAVRRLEANVQRLIEAEEGPC